MPTGHRLRSRGRLRAGRRSNECTSVGRRALVSPGPSALAYFHPESHDVHLPAICGPDRAFARARLGRRGRRPCRGRWAVHGHGAVGAGPGIASQQDRARLARRAGHVWQPWPELGAQRQRGGAPEGLDPQRQHRSRNERPEQGRDGGGRVHLLPLHLGAGHGGVAPGVCGGGTGNTRGCAEHLARPRLGQQRQPAKVPRLLASLRRAHRTHPSPQAKAPRQHA